MAARSGLDVGVWDLDAGAAEAVAGEVGELGRTGVACTVDVGDTAAVDAAMAATTASLGPVRYLVNNAGPPSTAPLGFDDAVRVCVGSVRAVTEAWLASGAAPDAAVVNVASIAGNLIATDSDWYTTAKAAIAGYTRYLAVKRADRVRANAVAPGFVDTPRMRASGFADSEVGRAMIERIPLRRVAAPEDIAGAILFLLSPLGGYTNGVVLPLDGGGTLAQ
ncbi:MAG: SDR family oxidoreductase [Acidimicrobiales bacterium]|nr:SDR family oxidoreductase [Acidimicrobiales bacterium]